MDNKDLMSKLGVIILVLTLMFFGLLLVYLLQIFFIIPSEPQPLPTKMTMAVVPLEAPPTATIVPTFTPLAATPTLLASPVATPVLLPSAAPTLTPTPLVLPTEMALAITSTLGYSAENRPIISYQFKDGPNKIIMVGGMHGGYEWNTILLAYELIDYFMQFPEQVPDSASLIIIPSANPDGQFAVVGKNGRFTADDIVDKNWEATFPGRVNGNQVDLNRNWDCLWTENAVWRNQPINPGANPFSEPETVALRDFLLTTQPTLAIFWHSTANGVFAARCPDVYAPSLVLANIYGSAANYPVYEMFTSYEITGDASDWLVKEEIPAVTVELATYATEFEQNKAGVLAVLNAYGSRVDCTAPSCVSP